MNSSEFANATSCTVDIIPGTNLQCQGYKLRLCPVRPPTNDSCITAPCNGTKCAVTGLKPGTTYNVTVICVDANGNEIPSSSTSTLTSSPEITLVSVNATSPYTGKAQAVPQPNDTFVEVCPCAAVLVAALQSQVKQPCLSQLEEYAGGLDVYCVYQGTTIPFLAACAIDLLQYIFTVVDLNCTSNCAPRIFNSSIPSVNFTGLTPGTTVSEAWW